MVENIEVARNKKRPETDPKTQTVTPVVLQDVHIDGLVIRPNTELLDFVTQDLSPKEREETIRLFKAALDDLVLVKLNKILPF